MKQEHQVGSLNNCISVLQLLAYTPRLKLQDARLGYVESRREQVRPQEELSMKEKFSETLRSAVCANWERWREIKNVRVDQVSVQKNQRKIMTQYKSSPLCCRKCKNRWILWMIQENFSKWSQITVWDCLTFPVSLQWFQVLVPCWAATNACLLTHVIHRDYRIMVLKINFLRLIHPEIILKEFTPAHHKENKNQFYKLQG